MNPRCRFILACTHCIGCVLTCRCTNLQQLTVTWSDGKVLAAHLQPCWVSFQGQGSTHGERQNSMQQQLAAMRSSTQLLAPASWPACGVLTSCRLSVDCIPPEVHALYMGAAAHTTSLASLDVCAQHVGSFTTLDALGSLQHLTQLQLCTKGAPDDDACEDVLAAIGQLTKLQRLKLDDSLFGTTGEGGGASIPGSWSALQALQQLELWYGTVDLPTLFHLTGLTSLEGTAVSEVEDAAPSDSGSTEAPQQWRDGLRHLSWGSCGRSSLPFLRQLTSLTSLHLKEVCVSPELVR
jgi:hypothetical protein